MKRGFFPLAFRSRISVVGIASRYRLDVLGFEPGWRQAFFVSCPSRRVLRLTQPHLLWVPALFSGGKAAGANLDTLARLVPRVRMSRGIPVLLLSASCRMLLADL